MVWCGGAVGPLEGACAAVDTDVVRVVHGGRGGDCVGRVGRARLRGRRVTELCSEELQGALWVLRVVGAVFCHYWVQRISHQIRSQTVHVDAQLVGFSGVGGEPVEAVVAATVHQFDGGVGVGFTGFFVAVQPVAGDDDAAADLYGLAAEQGKGAGAVGGVGEWGDGDVGFVGEAMGEEGLVGAAGVFVEGEEEDAGGEPVESVGGGDGGCGGGVAGGGELAAELDEGGVGDVAPAGDGGEEVWFVDDEEGVVPVEDGHVEGDGGFGCGEGAVGPEGEAAAGGGGGGNALAVVVDNGAGGELGGEEVAGAVEAFEEDAGGGAPFPFGGEVLWEAEAYGVHAVAQGERPMRGGVEWSAHIGSLPFAWSGVCHLIRILKSVVAGVVRDPEFACSSFSLLGVFGGFPF